MALAFFAAGLAAVHADDRSQLSLTWERSLEAERRFSDLLADFAAEEWESVVAGLENLRSLDAERLVEIEPGRFLSGRLAARVIAGRLPEAGRNLLQTQLGADAVLLQQSGRPDRPESWRRLLGDYFGVSETEPVISALAQDAWLRGDLDLARRYWTWLSDGATESAPTRWMLRSPRAALPAADIGAWLILCDLFDQRPRTARQRLKAFRLRFPEAEGRLGERTGLWGDLLEQVIEQSLDWPAFTSDPGVSPRPPAVSVIDLVRLRWREQAEFGLRANPRRAWAAGPIEKSRQVWPSLVDGVVIVPFTDRVRVLDTRTGRPAWPSGLPGDQGAVWVEPHSTDDASEAGNAAGALSPDRTMWVGRVGPGWLQPGEEPSRRDSKLVAIDLEAEGRVAWIRYAKDLFPEGRWCFSGVPLITTDSVIVTMRGTGRGLQLALVCLDVATGDVRWSRQPGAVVARPQSRPVLGLERLSAGWEATYWNVDGRMLLAVETTSGRLRWMTVLSSTRAARHSQEVFAQGQPKSFFDAGRLYVVDERAHVHAVDPETGARFWSTEIDDVVKVVVGVCDDVLIVAGNRLWGIDILTGRVNWRQGFDDPEGWIVGQPALVGRTILAPTRDELWSVDAWSGAFRQRRVLAPFFGPILGNLSVSESTLMTTHGAGLSCFEVEISRVPSVAAPRDSVD